MKLRSLCILATLAASGTACSRGGGPLDACTLIGPQRAGAILGTTVTVKHKGPTPRKPDDASLCFYSTGKLGGGFMLIAARIGFRDAQAEARSEMAEARKEGVPPGMPPSKVRAVDGPGQAAWLATIGRSMQLHVLDHGTSLVVSIDQPESPAADGRARKLAEAALAGLEHP